jgi:hypothetical protein
MFSFEISGISWGKIVETGKYIPQIIRHPAAGVGDIPVLFINHDLG